MECLEEEVGDKMVVEVDLTKYRVQPFKSYKVCVSVDDPTSSTFLPPTCSHLFSFERAVPYKPEVKEKEKKEEQEVVENGKEKEEMKGDSVNEEVRSVRGDAVGEERGVRRVKEERGVRRVEEERGVRRVEEMVEEELGDMLDYMMDDVSKVERSLPLPEGRGGAQGPSTSSLLLLSSSLLLTLSAHLLTSSPSPLLL